MQAFALIFLVTFALRVLWSLRVYRGPVTWALVVFARGFRRPFGWLFGREPRFDHEWNMNNRKSYVVGICFGWTAIAFGVLSLIEFVKNA